jgi:acetyltransferase-like isoleucine patch superfamily enzyme
MSHVSHNEVVVHETAVVEPGVAIGAGTRIWHHAHVRDGAVIGSGCNLGKNVYVDAGVVIGDRCKVQNNVSLYAGVTLEDEVFIGPSAVFTNDRFPRAHAEGGWDVVPTLVRTGASIGANATLVCGIEIGAWSTVAAGSVVTRDVVPHELVAGNPARRLGWVCRCGHVLIRGNVDSRPTTCERCGERLDGV